VNKAGGLVHTSKDSDDDLQMGPRKPKNIEVQSPTLSQINDLLIEHETKLHKKID
jgi:hypothetical protein